MTKFWVPVISASMLFLLIGCGGSSSSTSSVVPVAGAPLSEYSAVLPDGSPMELEIFSDNSQSWSGDFAVATETGAYAHQTGSFEGTVTGNAINATCEPLDGESFHLNGTVVNDTTLRLTRSDIPGVVLDFHLVHPAPKVSRGEVSFNFNAGSTNARLTMSNTPYSVQAGGTMTEYRGQWQGLNVTFWAYSSGYATLVIQLNDIAIASISFANYKLSDFATVTANSASGSISSYNYTTKAQVRFKASATVSP